MIKQRSLKQYTAETSPFPNVLTSFNHSISMDTKSSQNQASGRNDFIHVVVDYFVTIPTPKNFAHHAVVSKFHHWISYLVPLHYLATGKGAEYFSTYFANCFTLFRNRLSPWFSNASGTYVCVKVQYSIPFAIVVTRYCKYLQNDLTKYVFCFWSFQSDAATITCFTIRN